MSHVPAAKPEANSTLCTNKATYAGQLFFDQALVYAVKKVAPYSTNCQNLLKNNADSILLADAQTSDPFFNYVMLSGSDLSKGVFAWFSVGINQTFTSDIMAAAMRYKEGGKMNTANPKIPGLDAIFPEGSRRRMVGVVGLGPRGGRRGDAGRQKFGWLGGVYISVDGLGRCRLF